MTATATAAATVIRPRTIEDGHTKACLAHAMVNAIENARDAEDLSAGEFRTYLADGNLLGWAEGYLADNTVTCLCGPVRIPAPYAVGDTVVRLCDRSVGTVLAIDVTDRTGVVVPIDSPRAAETLVQVDLDVDGSDPVGVLGLVGAFAPVYCCACDDRVNRTEDGAAWVSAEPFTLAEFPHRARCLMTGNGSHRPVLA